MSVVNRTEVEGMGKHQSDLDFRLMAFYYKLRDLFSPPGRLLAEVQITEGCRVLDYGCGPGSSVFGAAREVGETGKVYALDIHPMAIENIKAIASRRRLTSVQAIQSDCETGLADRSVDIILLFDTFHHLDNSEAVLYELHRVLRPDGILSFSDHHMREDEILNSMTDKGLFRLAGRARRTYTFRRV